MNIWIYNFGNSKITQWWTALQLHMAASARVKCDGIPGGRFFNQIYGIPGVWYLEFQVAVFFILDICPNLESYLSAGPPTIPDPNFPSLWQWPFLAEDLAHTSNYIV